MRAVVAEGTPPPHPPPFPQHPTPPTTKPNPPPPQPHPPPHPLSCDQMRLPLSPIQVLSTPGIEISCSAHIVLFPHASLALHSFSLSSLGVHHPSLGRSCPGKSQPALLFVYPCMPRTGPLRVSRKSFSYLPPFAFPAVSSARPFYKFESPVWSRCSNILCKREVSLDF